MDSLTQQTGVDSLEQMLSMLLDVAVEVLDISPDLEKTAVEHYEEVGSWLAENGSPGWRIYPQGSFCLGTVVRPARVNEAPCSACSTACGASSRNAATRGGWPTPRTTTRTSRTSGTTTPSDGRRSLVA